MWSYSSVGKENKQSRKLNDYAYSGASILRMCISPKCVVRIAQEVSSLIVDPTEKNGKTIKY